CFWCHTEAIFVSWRGSLGRHQSIRPRDRVDWRRVAVTFGRGAELTANRVVAALATLAVLGVLAPAKAGVDRPPQVVVMAFDNCTELERWQELTDFASRAEPRWRSRSLHLFCQRQQFHRRCQQKHL